MSPKINNKLTIIECVLINELDPGYLEVSYQNGYLYCLLSKDEYKYMNLSERIYSVFEVLKMYCSDILNEYSIIVETLDLDELSGLFWMYNK